MGLNHLEATYMDEEGNPLQAMGSRKDALEGLVVSTILPPPMNEEERYERSVNSFS